MPLMDSPTPRTATIATAGLEVRTMSAKKPVITVPRIMISTALFIRTDRLAHTRRPTRMETHIRDWTEGASDAGSMPLSLKYVTSQPVREASAHR